MYCNFDLASTHKSNLTCGDIKKIISPRSITLQNFSIHFFTAHIEGFFAHQNIGLTLNPVSE